MGKKREKNWFSESGFHTANLTAGIRRPKQSKEGGGEQSWPNMNFCGESYCLCFICRMEDGVLSSREISTVKFKLVRISVNMHVNV